MITIRAVQGETLDQLLFRATGRTAGITEQVLNANPGLADKGAVLPEGTVVHLPRDPIVGTEIKTVQLWD